MKPENFHAVVASNKKLVKAFLDFPSLLYGGDKNWIRPLDVEIEKVFDPMENTLFRTGEAIRWLLFDSINKPVGRMAAFYNKLSANKNEQPTGGIGFFDCINIQEAANTLFDEGKKWLKERGMEAMDGPINFGSRDSFWGCLSEGFYEPVFNMPYNFPYYNRLFENYGFKNYFNQYTYIINIENRKPVDSIMARVKRLQRNSGYRFELINLKRANGYAWDIMHIYNLGWAKFHGVRKMRKSEARTIIKELKPILDPRAVIFGYHKKEPVGFYVMIPELNQIIKKFHGKFGLIQKLRLLFDLKIMRKANRLIGIVFGVIPEHQGKGVEAGLVMRMEEEITKPGFPYKNIEMNWIGDFNPTMMKLVEKIGGNIYKTHITYRYLFNPAQKFERAKKI